MMGKNDSKRQAASPGGVALTPRQQSDLDLLTQSGLGGLFFTIGAVALSLVEPLIWQHPVIASTILLSLGVLMVIRVRMYLTLPAQNGFVLPKLYYVCLLGNAGLWGVFAAWIVSLPPQLNASSAITITLTAGAACGGSVAMAMDQRLSRSLVLLYIVPLVLYLLWFWSQPQLLTLALLFILFVVYLFNLSGKQNLSYWKMVNNTEQLRKQTQELAEARNEAVRANQARSEFLAHISHEIRTPLNGVISMAGTMAATPLDDHQQDQMNVILQSGKLMMGLINDVLDFSEVNDGTVMLGPVDVDLRELAHSTLNMLEPLTRPRGNRTEFTDQMGDFTWVRVDRMRLQQLLTNLLVNANKFTQNGTVELRVCRMAGVRSETDLLRFEVHDDGTDISPTQQKQIFEEYYQLSRNDPTSRGTGLGLAICSRLIKLLGGRIGVKSEQSQGSCFWFEIPYVPGTPVAAQDSHIGEQAELRPVQVLVVEDDVVNQKVITAYLNKLQLPYAVADDGQQALESYMQIRPTHIMMDCSLPDITGMEVTRRIRALEHEKGFAEAVIVAVTAHSASHVLQECFDSGMNDHLPKPVTLRSVQSMMDKWS
ncbi:MAG: ATP-binding protein [Pseudomonadota bacterium]